jgi:hypothetical protein
MQSSGTPRTLLNEPGLSFRGPATPQPDDHAAGCRAEESTVGWHEAGRGSPHQRRGGETASQGQCGASRQATRRRTVDSSVAHRVPSSGRVRGVRSLGMTDWGGRCFPCSPAGLRAPAGRTGLSFRGPATPQPDAHAAGCRAEESTVGLGRGRTRQHAPSPRRRNSQTGPVWGVAAGHEEAESRFLGRAPGSVVSQGAGCALPRNDRLGGPRFHSCWMKPGLSFRGPATPQLDDHTAGCRAEESTVGSCEARRGSPHHRRGGETASQGQCGLSRQATRRRKVDSSVVHRVPSSGRVPGVRSLGMTDWGARSAGPVPVLFFRSGITISDLQRNITHLHVTQSSPGRWDHRPHVKNDAAHGSRWRESALRSGFGTHPAAWFLPLSRVVGSQTRTERTPSLVRSHP